MVQTQEDRFLHLIQFHKVLKGSKFSEFFQRLQILTDYLSLFILFHIEFIKIRKKFK